MIPAILINDTTVTVFMNNQQYVAQKGSHVNYDSIMDAIKRADWAALPTLFDVRAAVAKYTNGLVEIINDDLYYNGNVMHNALSRRILQMFGDGFNVAPMVRFLENMMQNPSRTAVDELYLFLDTGQMPITDDGCFLAYKKVRSDFKDIYSGQMDNSPGQRVTMPRNEVDDRRDNTCSYGLHFCAKGYLSHYGCSNGSRVVIVKINPKDVVSIPSDYSNTKGRCSEYLVVGEYTGSYDQEAFSKPVYNRDDVSSQFGHDDDTWDSPDDEYDMDENDESSDDVLSYLSYDELEERLSALQDTVGLVTNPALKQGIEAEIEKIQTILFDRDDDDLTLGEIIDNLEENMYDAATPEAKAVLQNAINELERQRRN